MITWLLISLLGLTVPLFKNVQEGEIQPKMELKLALVGDASYSLIFHKIEIAFTKEDKLRTYIKHRS